MISFSTNQKFQFVNLNFSSILGEEDAKAEDVDGKYIFI